MHSTEKNGLRLPEKLMTKVENAKHIKKGTQDEKGASDGDNEVHSTEKTDLGYLKHR